MWWTEGDLWLPEAQRSELTYCVLSMRVCSHSTCGVRQASYVAYFCMFFTYEPCIVFSPRQDVSVGTCWVSMCAHMHFCRNVSLCSLFFFWFMCVNECIVCSSPVGFPIPPAGVQANLSPSLSIPTRAVFIYFCLSIPVFSVFPSQEKRILCTDKEIPMCKKKRESEPNVFFKFCIEANRRQLSQKECGSCEKTYV